MSLWPVSEREDQIRLLDFIDRKLKGAYSKRQIKRKIEQNQCLVNGQMERFASCKLLAGDKVQFDPSGLGQESPLPEYNPKRVLFEDNALLIYNKPSGISSDPQGMLALLKPCGRLHLVHRLDKETSGVLVLAKTEAVEKQLAEAFRLRDVKKEYLALVDGVPKRDEGSIQNYLGKVGSYHGQTLYGQVPQNLGKLAKTDWRLKRKGAGIALLHCYPETGRTHQIRVHLAGIGSPILGDYQYEKHFKTHTRPQRLMLHAYRVIFNHPMTGEKMKVEAPIPKDFLKIMEKLQ